MAIDFDLPTLATLKASFLTYIVDNIKAVAKMNFSGASNIPSGAIRWNSTDNKFEIYTDSAWGNLSSEYDIVAALASSAATLTGMGSTVSEIDYVCDGATNTSFSPGGDLTGTVYVAKVGRIVTLSWGSLSHTSASYVEGSAGSIPTKYRPLVNARVLYYMDGSKVTLCTVTTAGTLGIRYWTPAGSSYSDTGAEGGCLSYVSSS